MIRKVLKTDILAVEPLTYQRVTSTPASKPPCRPGQSGITSIESDKV